MFGLLSHHLKTSTPGFANGESIEIRPIKEISSGGSSNNYAFGMPCHLGTHIDAPKHFDDDGRPIASFSPDDLVFERPVLIPVPKASGELFSPNDLEDHRQRIGEADLLLIRTGFQRYRTEDPVEYSTRNPGFSPDAALYLRGFSGLRAVGFDFISLSSVVHREEGREAHRALLKGRDFFIIEDMDLSRYPSSPKRVIVAPLFIEGVDSAPCTVLVEH